MDHQKQVAVKIMTTVANQPENVMLVGNNWEQNIETQKQMSDLHLGPASVFASRLGHIASHIVMEKATETLAHFDAVTISDSRSTS